MKLFFCFNGHSIVLFLLVDKKKNLISPPINRSCVSANSRAPQVHNNRQSSFAIAAVGGMPTPVVRRCARPFAGTEHHPPLTSVC